MRPIVLVSGRDDHGLLVARTIGVTEEPDLAQPSRGRVADGTLVSVVDSRGEWIRIRTLEGRSLTGWINDFYLRGTVHLAGNVPGCPVPASRSPGAAVTFRFPPSAQVELLELEQGSGQVWVRVRSVKTRHQAWVDRKAVAELPTPATRVAPSAASCPVSRG